MDIRDAAALSEQERALLGRARLHHLADVEAWRVRGTNQQVAYSTHGVFRFFGKFPPPLVQHLIEHFTRPGDWVLDPMAGSGTTAVEALALGRHAVVRDVSPLSLLLCRVKTTHVGARAAAAALRRVEARRAAPATTPLPEPLGLRHPEHWFLPETLRSLGALRAAIDQEAPGAARDLLTVSFLSTIRRVSRATTQQGRLFLDASTAREDAWPTFCQRFTKYARAVAALPRRPGTCLRIEAADARSPASPLQQFQLAITHPPYFNNYKYSSVNSLELAWLGVSAAEVRRTEIREAFKVGKPERVAEYVEDLTTAVSAIASQLVPGGTLALMMGDTVIRDSYVDVTRQVVGTLERTAPSLALRRVVLRVPQYTEASWVASQRRRADRVGVTLNDFLLLFTRRDP